jgi:hypothetical protein
MVILYKVLVIMLDMAEIEAETKSIRQFLNALNSASVPAILGDIIKNAISVSEHLILNNVTKKYDKLSTTINLL